MVSLSTKITNQLDAWTERWALTRTELFFGVFLVFAFISGVQAHLMPKVYPLTRYITDVLLLVVCAPLLWFCWQRHQDQRFWWWCGVTYIITFFTEVAGVATGQVFGEYAYGATMWVQWLQVPLVIALNWTLLILAMHQLAIRLAGTTNTLLIALLTALLIVTYDYCIEPVAIALDYWQWAGNVIPLQNYLAWGLIAAIFSGVLSWFKIKYQHPLLLVYAGAQLAFFVLLNIFFKA